MRMWYLLIGLMTWWSCQTPPENSFSFYTPLADSVGYVFPYDLSRPDTTFHLPAYLVEISGLTLGYQEKYLVTHNDEKGVIYLVNTQTGAVEQQVYFRKDGDYEGIEVVAEDIYVMKSTGTLYQVRHLMTEGQETIKHGNFLDGDYDVEGLAYDSANQRLLLACKGDSGLGDDRLKAIYGFHLDRMALDSTPVYTLSLEEIRSYLEQGPEISKLDKLLEYFEDGSSELVFSPSAIAIHPVTGHLYLTSAVKDLLLVMDVNGQVLYLEKLQKSIHRQAEGLAFAEDGTLWLSNEGKKITPGMIHRFDHALAPPEKVEAKE